MNDSILCNGKQDAHEVIDAIGGEHIQEFEYLADGKIRIILDCKLSDIKGANE